MKHSASENSSASFFLGVDGGGSKTLAIVVDAQAMKEGVDVLAVPIIMLLDYKK